MNLANKLTLLRFFLTPAIALSYFLSSGGWSIIAFFLFVVAVLSDFADGYVAKSMNFRSDLGRDLDPLADKFLTTFVLVFIVAKNGGNAWVVWSGGLIIVREVFVTGLRSIVGGSNLPVTILSKFKTFVQFLSIGLFLFPFKERGLNSFCVMVLFSSALLSVLTAQKYTVRFLRFLNHSK